VGYFFNHLAPSLTLGCGTGGKNITTENITAKNLINVQRVSRRKPNELWFSFNQANYYDESLSVDEIMNEYYKNH
jgi:acetaldehyde dehydrogenase/alcohol dehydrogenase